MITLPSLFSQRYCSARWIAGLIPLIYATETSESPQDYSSQESAFSVDMDDGLVWRKRAHRLTRYEGSCSRFANHFFHRRRYL